MSGIILINCDIIAKKNSVNIQIHCDTGLLDTSAILIHS